MEGLAETDGDAQCAAEKQSESVWQQFNGFNEVDVSNSEEETCLQTSESTIKRNKLPHPKGGLASSYEFDIMGFGGVDEKSNMQIVRRKGEAPIFASVEGIRGFNGSTGSFMNPKTIASPVDGAHIHYMDPGVGAVVWDPTKVIQYHPEILQ